MRLWNNNPETIEGKYPIVLRRDGSVLDVPYMVITFNDPCAPASFRAYADAAEAQDLDPEYVADFRAMALRAEELQEAGHVGDPDAPRHRRDDPAILAWARTRQSQGM